MQHINCVLYRMILDNQEEQKRQLILPTSLKEEVLCQVHDQMGHRGVEYTTTLDSSQIYLAWNEGANAVSWGKSSDRKTSCFKSH